jgi:cytochrome P450
MPSAATVALYLDKVLAKGGGEFIGEFTVPLPVAVISALLGLPPDMTHKCKEWSDALMEPLSGMLSEEREIECAHEFVERQQYFSAAVERIRREGGPPEHLITRVALARTEDSELFGMPEALSLIEQHMIAGNETTTHDRILPSDTAYTTARERRSREWRWQRPFERLPSVSETLCTRSRFCIWRWRSCRCG